MLCAERAVGGEPFAVLLADDFLTDYSPGVTGDLVEAFKKTGNPQISFMNVGLQDVSKYGIIVRSHSENQINGLVVTLRSTINSCIHRSICAHPRYI